MKDKPTRLYEMSGATNVYERTEEARWFFSYCKKQ